MHKLKVVRSDEGAEYQPLEAKIANLAVRLDKASKLDEKDVERIAAARYVGEHGLTPIVVEMLEHRGYRPETIRNPAFTDAKAMMFVRNTPDYSEILIENCHHPYDRPCPSQKRPDLYYLTYIKAPEIFYADIYSHKIRDLIVGDKRTLTSIMNRSAVPIISAGVASITALDGNYDSAIVFAGIAAGYVLISKAWSALRQSFAENELYMTPKGGELEFRHKALMKALGWKEEDDIRRYGNSGKDNAD